MKQTFCEVLDLIKRGLLKNLNIKFLTENLWLETGVSHYNLYACDILATQFYVLLIFHHAKTSFIIDLEDVSDIF